MFTRRVLSIVIQVVLGVTIVVVAAVLLLDHFGIAETVKPYVVMSGSMEPAVKLGSVAVVKPQPSYRPNDIITFAPNGNHENPVTHRIVFRQYINGIGEAPVYLTAGDVNENFDRWQVRKEHIVGKVLFSIPYIGYLVNFAKQPFGFILLVIVPATIVIYEELKFVRREVGRLILKLKKRVRLYSSGRDKTPLKTISINLLPKQEGALSKRAAFVPLLGAVLVFVAVSGSYFFDLETNLSNILGVDTSFGEETATIYDNSPFTCPGGASTTDDPFGFVVFDIENSTLVVDVSLDGATANSTYDIWVNQDPGACPLASPTAPGALTTDGSGDGVAHVETALVGTATKFWISAVGGGQVLRSVAVSF